MFLIFFIFLFHSSLSISQPLHLAIKTGSSITTFSGQSSGATTWDSTKVGFGEPVFSTAMSGYIESLTDPSFQGQILILTFPLIGNYGVPRLMSNSTSLCAPYLAPESHESHRIQIAGLIVSSLIDGTDIDSVQTLRQWLISEGIPVISGVNTRKLVQFLTKQKSTSTSVITTNIHATEIQTMPHQLLLQPRFSAFSCISKSFNSKSMSKSKSKSTWSRTRILVLDFGVKHSIIRMLLKYNVDVAVVPFDTNLREEMLRNPYHGLVLSNGPGDPTRHHKTIAHIRDVLVTASKNDQFFHLPVLGICLGFQLLSLALNENTNETLPIATIQKLSFGHRGFNHPVMVHCSNTANTKTNNSKIGYLTSQNHGYSVQFSNQINNQKNYYKQWFVNLHDDTSAGMYFKNRPLMAVQFHPEGGGGPHDTIFIFKTFISLAKKYSTSPRSTRKTETQKDKNPIPELTSSLASSSEPWPPFRLENNFTAPSYSKHQTILILGSGGIMIGQAGEFDYAGSQALKTLRARGIKTILVNPNVASSQTSKGLADIVYFVPLEPDSVEQVLLKHPEITGILLSFGGQTALNVGLVLDANNILQQHNVDILGTSITGIEITEDRNLFKEMLNTINEKAAPSIVVTTLTHGLVSANKIGYPVLIRRAFALGGLGSSFANNATEFEQLFILATTTNDPNGKPAQIIIDKSLLGWKEIEFDVMRDRYGNVIVICTIENLDPVGVHTGESIVIAPSQTLNDHAYQTLRTASIKIANAIGLIGECNIQFAINPLSPANALSFEYTVIEVNPRLSRSSALASKATGYPIASIATELSLGYSLTELYNPMTGNTTAFFEPVLDYVVVKIPRWDFAMFGNEVDTTISTSMKSIGEAMGIGRTFSEALQKALRMVSSNKQNGFESNNVCLTNSRDFKTSKDLKDLLMKNLSQPGEKRMSYIASAFDHHGMSALEISSATNGINIFFLDLMKETLRLGQELCKYSQVNELSDAFLRTIKKNGYSDYQISNRICSNNYNSKIECNTNVIRQWRTKRGIIPLVQKIDTTAGEFEAKSNYLYMTYADLNFNLNSKEEIASFATRYTPSFALLHRSIATTNKIIVLGSGVYRVGASVEFDHSVVECLRTVRNVSPKTTTIVVNHNPETVSTDYDESDRLYFEELSHERILDILEYEQIMNKKQVIVTFGGQASQNVVPSLLESQILGTPASSIIRAENRMRHSSMLDLIHVSQPEWCNSTDMQELLQFATKIGYPVIIRPSFVLAGAAMKVIYNEANLKKCIEKESDTLNKYPFIVSKFYTKGKEIDVDVVGKKGKIVVLAISEHIEDVGVHSGDATMIHPTINIPTTVLLEIEQIAIKICHELKITGLFNLQIIYVPSDDASTVEEPAVPELRVIETNVRSSRSIPFVTKSTGISFVEEATRAILDLPISSNFYLQQLSKNSSKIAKSKNINEYSVKTSIFSFDRLQGNDVLLGVTMKSTGENVAYSTIPGVAFLRSMRASKRLFPPPPRVSVTSVNHGYDAIPYQCLPPVPPIGNTLSSGKILCVEIRGLVMESKLIVSSEINDLLALLDEMLDLGYNLAKCNIDQVSSSNSIEVEAEIEIEVSVTSTIISEKLLPSISMFNTNVVGLIDICASSSICAGTESETVEYNAYKMRRTAMDLNVPVFTDRRVVEMSIHAWKDIKKKSC